MLPSFLGQRKHAGDAGVLVAFVVCLNQFSCLGALEFILANE